MKVAEQIRNGVLVCPRTKQPLTSDGDALTSGLHCYIQIGNVPVLTSDQKALDAYARESRQMLTEYAQAAGPSAKPKRVSWLTRLRTNDYRTRASVEARGFLRMLDDESKVGVSIGGGPKRIHRNITTLNIGLFPNVDVVGDAHELPYADNSVDALYCEAVLEHLHTPIQAVAEMHRVLRPGGRVYACTPFICQYHGYPHHYQNFTLTGHQHLFRDFEIEQAGSCVGPVYTMRAMTYIFLKTYLPRPLNLVAVALFTPVSLMLAPLDNIVGNHPQAHVLASTTYLVGRKR